jgi:hypothetical protein
MRIILTGVCVAVLAMASGCWPPLLVPGSSPLDPGPQFEPKLMVRTARPPVTPDQVTPGNAREMAEALWEELDRAQTPEK